MSALTVRLPNSVHQKIKELAARDDISVNQFIASAAAEKMASVMTLDFLKSEAAKGRRSDYQRYLSMVPNAPAQAGDELVGLAHVLASQRRVGCQPDLQTLKQRTL